MSRSGPIAQLGMRPPARRPTDEQQPAQPVTQPSPHWPPQHGEPQAQRGQQQHGYGQQPAPGYYFPQPGAEGDAGHAYAQHAPTQPLPFNRFPPPEAAPQASAHQLPFNRFPPPAADPDPNYGYAPQGSEQQQPPFSFPHTAQPQQPGSAGPPWGQQADPRGYDLNNYMSAPGQQGYAQPDPAQFQPQHQEPPFAAAHGYGESDAEFDETMVEDEEEPRRGRRGLMIVAALVGAIGLGGGMAYGYKTFFPSRSGPAPVIKDTAGPIKSKPEVADGKGFAHTDKKLLNRLGDEAGPPGTGAAPADAPDDRASDDPNAPRKVRLIPISPGGPQPMPGMVVASPPAPAGPGPMVAVPGVTLENMGPPPSGGRGPMQQLPPSAARVQLPAPAAMPPARAVQQPPVRVASAASMPPPAAAEPAAPMKRASVAQVAPERSPVPKTKVAAAPAVTASSGAGFVAVLSSQKSRMDALKIFANMQEKYGDVLSSRTPDVQEANLGEKGVWYRLVVGPPGSRDAAATLCTQLKTAGYAGCWVTAY